MSDPSSPSDDPIAERGPVRAPELDGAAAWLNVDVPLTLADLRGKVVLLDFWTYGCINCLHQLPGLRELLEAYADELVVIGVHAPKFPNERETGNLRRVIERYAITHPVASDPDYRIWRAYTVRAWPTLVLIDPAGYLVAGVSGEGHLPQFDRAIRAVIQVFDERGELDRSRRLGSSGAATGSALGPLAYPGGLACDSLRDRLYIADTSHHQVLVATTDGAQVGRLGSGRPSAVDGDAGECGFVRPQGLAVQPSDGLVFVADTGNHLIRAADPEGGAVTTIAGTGAQARPGDRGGGVDSTALSSPWDVCPVGRLLLIAMAGVHQLWVLDVGRGLVFALAGSGMEARQDGDLDDSAFAQPSGLTGSEGAVFVADSESNVIRRVELPPRNRVHTLAGGDLFEFGDQLGVGDEARFQHPLGVAWFQGRLFVADTYNHRIKWVDPGSGEVGLVAGSGRLGHKDGDAEHACFHEPSGLSAGAGRLYVADTNNHAVRVVDLASGRVETLIAP